MIRSLLVSAAVALLSCRAFPQNYPALNHVRVNVHVSHELESGMYYYSYTLSNDVGNTGEIQEFVVDASRQAGSVPYDTTGLRFASSEYMERNFRRRFPHLASSCVPAGFSHLPPGWGAIWGNYPRVSLSKDTLFVPPGASIPGIEFMSQGLPGIRSCEVRPHFDLGAYFDLFDTTGANDNVNLDSIRQAIKYDGWTVGPWAPEQNFRPIVFIDTLSSFTIRSRSFAWITSQPVADKYAGYFSTARTQVQTGNVQAARTTLGTVLHDVRIDSASSLSSEAYALIRFNTEYLLSKLTPSRDVKGGLFIGLLTAPTLSQPLGFSSQALPDPTGYLNPVTEIFKTDLAIGQKTHFVSVPGVTRDLFPDAAQRWLFHLENTYLGVTRIADTTNTFYLAINAGEVYPPLHVPSSHFYVMWWTAFEGGEEFSVAKILSEDSLFVTDSLSGDIVRGGSPFLSADQNTLYVQVGDTGSAGADLLAFSLATRSTQWRRPLREIGPREIKKAVQDGKGSKALIDYYAPPASFDTHYCFTYDPERDLATPPIKLPPYRVLLQLSATGREILAERADVDTIISGWPETRTGDVWVFDASSGRVVRKFKFPEGGNVTVIESDTVHFYYHVEEADTWYKATLAPGPDVKGGLFFTPPGSSNTLILKAKAAITYTQSDTLIFLTATVRRPVRFGVTLGTVTSSYGFAKVDTPMTAGDYRYQKFSTSQRTALPWQAGGEYELFSNSGMTKSQSAPLNGL